ncbi:type II toxin-antitoxin system VapC family toxin [Streptomyces acidiscabies]|uniref:Ribonuclease VapC n=1 Tax=Streptomyces acidiscabies TaxID=42234 RepID=A0AAP6BLD6_9ACTN|nr:PIN domain-containing protein [Streptomyces acidiscabies]MBP5938325.1 PIN domain-containing protein [Streptomyces sp. LBUM 1476]MBZ3909357.1 PIN domain-containing protein [Streptomyces acidiscabies]MDX2966868.1 PIN domain-containing protein [Streptomyces acidiscabies]MDX3019951.1 PIN domain-containing protein [Streptomyces acidiscabies]MDX3796740.1 PIN domain-containing protein [Streptomyces acidiscabies]
MIVVDTGPLVALADADDAYHAACVRWYDTVHPRNLVIPAPVLAEACHLIGTRCGAQVEAAFLDALAAGDLGTVTSVMPEDIRRMAHLVRQYADLPLGGTDACVVAIAERWQTKQVATVDRRHFTVVRPSHVPAFELLPQNL